MNNTNKIQRLKKRETKVFIDIDGTIKPFNGNIPQEVLKVINNHPDYIVATGRPLNEIREFGLLSDCVGSNGAEVVVNGELIYRSAIPKERVIDIVNFLIERNGNVTVCTNHGRFMNNIEDMEGYIKNIVTCIHGELTEEKYNQEKQYFENVGPAFDNILDVFNNPDLCVTKIECGSFDNLEEDLEILSKYKELYSFNSFPGHLEIVSGDVNKASGIKRYLGNRDVNIITLGDGLNDMEMFELADVSYAMENGVDQLKSISTHIAPSVEEIGFFKVIEHINSNYMK